MIRSTGIFQMVLVVAALWVSTVSGAEPGARDRSKDVQDSCPLEISVRLDKDCAAVAEPIQLELVALASTGTSVRFPQTGDQLGELLVVESNDHFDLPHGPRRQWIRRIQLESLAPGEFTIPPLTLHYSESETGSHGTRNTDPLKVTIHSVLSGDADPLQYRDIKSVMNLPEPRQSGRLWLAWAAGTFLGLGGLVVVATILGRGRYRGLTPCQAALRSLDELAFSDACREEDGKQFYIQLTTILRVFVQRQFAIKTPHLTTDEFLDQARIDPRISEQDRDGLGALLKAADEFKFAGMTPSPENFQAAIGQTRNLIESMSGENEPQESE